MQLENLFEGRDSAISRDLKLNLQKLLEGGTLSAQESHLVLLATAKSVAAAPLVDYAREKLKTLDLTDEAIREAEESAAIVGMLNIYYRFRHLVGNDEDYRSAGLRMTSLARPVLGKATFEALSFAVSVLNGCEKCIRAHEEVLKREGYVPDKIHDLARLAAVVKGIRALL